MKTVKMVLQVFLILVVVLVVMVFFNPFVGLVIKYTELEIATAQEELPVALAKWDEQNIEHSSLEIKSTNHICFTNARVEVRDEKVIQANVTGDMFVDIPLQSPS